MDRLVIGTLGAKEASVAILLALCCAAGDDDDGMLSLKIFRKIGKIKL